MPALILGELAMKQERALEEKAGTQARRGPGCGRARGSQEHSWPL